MLINAQTEVNAANSFPLVDKFHIGAISRRLLSLFYIQLNLFIFSQSIDSWINMILNMDDGFAG